MTQQLQLPADHVQGVADQFDDEVIERALEILDVWDPSTGGRSPTTVAATAVYVAAFIEDVNVTQGEAAEAFDRTPQVVQSMWNDCFQTWRAEVER